MFCKIVDDALEDAERVNRLAAATLNDPLQVFETTADICESLQT